MARKILINILGALAVVAIMLSLPLIAMLLFTMRGAVILVLTIGIPAGLAAYAFSPAFREWFWASTELFVNYKGLRLATDVKIHPGHSWARINGDVLVGADDLVQAALGPVDSVNLPAAGTHVAQGEPLFSIRHGDRVVNVPSPVSGTVLAVNPALQTHPELINAEPFEHGWAVRLRGEQPDVDRRRLLRGREARNWFRAATDRVLALLPTRGGAASDTSVPVEQLHRQLDDQAWHKLFETDFTSSPNQRGLQV